MALKYAEIEKFLTGGDLRSLGSSEILIKEMATQKKFNLIFRFFCDSNPVTVLRAADVAEKISRLKPQLLQQHKNALLCLSCSNPAKEFQWHLAQLLPRLKLNPSERGQVWDILTNWAMDKLNSRIVRVNSLQGLYEISKIEPLLAKDLGLTFAKLEREQIPSVNARIRILRKLSGREHKAIQ